MDAHPRSYRIGGGISIDGPGCGGGGGGGPDVARGLGTGAAGEPLGAADELGPGEAVASGLGDAVDPGLARTLGTGDSSPCVWQLAISVPIAKRAAIPATKIRPRPARRRLVAGVMRQG
jgi:hypothetical protein